MKLKTIWENEEIEVDCEVFKTEKISFGIFKRGRFFYAFEIKTGRGFGVGPHETFYECMKESYHIIEKRSIKDFKIAMSGIEIINHEQKPNPIIDRDDNTKNV